jgi:hypothetical protein
MVQRLALLEEPEETQALVAWESHSQPVLVSASSNCRQMEAISSDEKAPLHAIKPNTSNGSAVGESTWLIPSVSSLGDFLPLD